MLNVQNRPTPPDGWRAILREVKAKGKPKKRRKRIWRRTN
jgi:hypothetical protein